MSIGKSIIARWDGASLGTAICPLYLGTGFIDEKGATSHLARVAAGSPEGLVLPRAEFSSSEESIIGSSPCGIMLEISFFIHLWSDDEDALTNETNGYMKRIREQFHNGNMAVAGRFTMDAGGVSRVAFHDAQYYPLQHQDRTVYYSEQQFVVDYTRENTTPNT